MKVLVIGANGQIGSMVVEKMKKNSPHTPKSMVRKEEQVSKFEEQGVEVVLADLEKDFKEAFEGCDAVIFTAGSGADTGKDKTQLVDREGAKKAIDYAKQTNTSRFIMVSAFGADFDESDWPDSMKHYYEAKADADKALMQSGLQYTILKPGRLTNDEGSGKIDLGERTEERKGSVPREDVADVIVKLINHEPAFKKSFELLEGDKPIDEYFK